MRIDKYLANMNVGSRKEVHQLIKKGIVAVNDVIVKTPKQQVKESDQVTVNGDAVAYQKYHYFLLNKPKGVLSATEDRSQPTGAARSLSRNRTRWSFGQGYYWLAPFDE